MSEDRNEQSSEIQETNEELLEKEKKEKAKQRRIDLKEEKAVSKVPQVKRRMKGDETVHHDLFKLLIAKVKKNAGYGAEDPIIAEYEHCHFFHSLDSNGRVQDFCAPSAGHIHKIKWGHVEKIDDKGKKYLEPKISHVGPPAHAVSVKKGKPILVDPKNRLDDKHIHECEYIDSEVINVRKTDPKAAADMAQRANEDAEYFNSNFKTS